MITNEQIDYIMDLLQDKKKHLNDQYKVILKMKNSGMDHVNGILAAMEFNSELEIALNKMKKEVDNGIFGYNY